MPQSRRTFLKSLSRTALVLTLEDVLSLALPAQQNSSQQSGMSRQAYDAKPKPAPKTISALAWQPAGGCVAAAYFGGVCLWDADDFIVQKEFPYANGIHALVWSPNSRWLVSGNQDPSVHLWIPAEDVELQMSGYEGKVKELPGTKPGRGPFGCEDQAAHVRRVHLDVRDSGAESDGLCHYFGTVSAP